MKAFHKQSHIWHTNWDKICDEIKAERTWTRKFIQIDFGIGLFTSGSGNWNRFHLKRFEQLFHLMKINDYPRGQKNLCDACLLIDAVESYPHRIDNIKISIIRFFFSLFCRSLSIVDANSNHNIWIIIQK